MKLVTFTTPEDQTIGLLRYKQRAHTYTHGWIDAVRPPIDTLFLFPHIGPGRTLSTVGMDQAIRVVLLGSKRGCIIPLFGNLENIVHGSQHFRLPEGTAHVIEATYYAKANGESTSIGEALNDPDTWKKVSEALWPVDYV